MVSAVKAKGNATDMTTGSITRHVISFALPLLAGNIFQQLYNTVDTWVVGNYVSNAAFSAVGTVGPVTNMLVGFFLALSTGAGVVISQYFGAKQLDKVHKTVHTAIVMTFVFSVVLSILGIILTPWLLDFMKLDAESKPEAIIYLRIYFAGLIGLLFYNMGSAILRAVGDSKRPFYFLVVSAVLNIALDLLFVLGFGMGVEGVAFATVIAQGISAFLVMLSLYKSDTCVVIRFRDLSLDNSIFSKILAIGLPSAVQTAFTSFSNVFVLSYINYFGMDCMSGWTAYSKIDQFVLLPLQSVGIAATTFVGQNLGQGLVKRAKKGANVALLIAFISSVAVMIPVMLFAPELVRFFNNKEEVVEYGSQFIMFIFPFFFTRCVNITYMGALRGAGNTRIPTFLMLCSFVAFRQVYLYIMSNFIANEVIPIGLGFPAGWIVCSLSIFIYYKKTDLTKNIVIKTE